MNPIAPPAFTDHPTRMRRVGGPGGAVEIATLDARQRVLAAILVTHHRAGPHPIGPIKVAARVTPTRSRKPALR
jgi:hypothetical protein